MKKIIYVLNFILVIGIIASFVHMGVRSMNPVTLSVDLAVKKLKSSDFLALSLPQTSDEDDNVVNEDDLAKAILEDEIVEEVVLEDTLEDEDIEIEEEIVEDVSTPDSSINNSDVVLETQVGSLSGYGPDCIGCSGILASGLDVRNGNITYTDSTYGVVRILAGDRIYPEGTIVRVKNSSFSEFLGIVLDRGGDIGFGKSHLFDLLYPTSAEAYANGVSYQTTFEILRYGY